MAKETIVIGLGNPLMADEGIGVVLIERLEALAREGKIPGADRIQFYDGGTGGMNLLHVLAGRRKAVLIDCARMGTEPGTIRRFTPDQVQTIKQLAHLSLHEVDILKVLDISRQLGECPEEVVFFGIEPLEICQRIGLSPLLEKQIPYCLHSILRDIAPAL
ncbi:MAG: hydrogenase maturation protease [Anaerohalosphaeraceae bacterium]